MVGGVNGGSFNETLVPMTAEFDNSYVFPVRLDPSIGVSHVMIPERQHRHGT
jgi:hypothetical protein